MEEQLGALGLVLNCIVLWNTFYTNAALEQLRAEGYPVRDEDLARLSPFVRHHLGTCTAATRSCCPTSPAAYACCATRTPKTTTGSSPGPRLSQTTRCESSADGRLPAESAQVAVRKTPLKTRCVVRDVLRRSGDGAGARDEDRYRILSVT